MTLKTKFSKVEFTVTAVALIVGAWQLVPDAASGDGWYCVHVKNHALPSAGELSFVDQFDWFYVDHRHSYSVDAEKVAYLTFDAGYGNASVEKILDTLKE